MAFFRHAQKAHRNPMGIARLACKKTGGDSHRRPSL
jgi:hypothetical protein